MRATVRHQPIALLLTLAGVWLASRAAGCAAPQHLVHCPVDPAQLSKQMLAITPVGTPRDEAVAKLKAAGVRGEFGGKKSPFGQDYFYCDAWRRTTGEEWKISMLVHFDPTTGRLTEALELPPLSPANTKGSKKTRRATPTSVPASIVK